MAKEKSELKEKEGLTSLAQALALFQTSYTAPKKTQKVEYTAKGRTVSYSWAPLNEVVEAIRVTAGPLGISFSTEFEEVFIETKLFIRAIVIIRHSSGETERIKGVLLPANMMSIQDMGSVRTYAERYALSSVFGIASEDDEDAQKGEEALENQRMQEPSKAQQEKEYKDTVNGYYAKIRQIEPNMSNEQITSMVCQRAGVQDIKQIAPAQVIANLKTIYLEVDQFHKQQLQQQNPYNNPYQNPYGG